MITKYINIVYKSDVLFNQIKQNCGFDYKDSIKEV